MEAIVAATATNHDLLEIDAGRLQAGRLADIVLIDGDPLQDISSTYKVKKVIANGRVYDAAALAAQKQP